MAVRFSLDFEKTLAAIVYLSSSGIHDLTKYKACKLIFLADKRHLVRFGRPITGDRICAMELGPVPSETLNMFNALISENTAYPHFAALSEHLAVDRVYANPRFGAKKTLPFEELLSRSDMEALDQTIRDHGSKSFEELKALTHEMFAYKRAWSGTGSPTIQYEDLFVEDSDAIEGTLEEMIEDDQLRKAFGTSGF
jgi:uncharacterized phage-associated protein